MYFSSVHEVVQSAIEKLAVQMHEVGTNNKFHEEILLLAPKHTPRHTLIKYFEK